MAIVPPKPTRFVFVAGWVFDQYQKDRERLSRAWPFCPFDKDLDEVHQRMVVASIVNLRGDALRAVENGHTGPYPIPV